MVEGGEKSWTYAFCLPSAPIIVTPEPDLELVLRHFLSFRNPDSAYFTIFVHFAGTKDTDCRDRFG